MLLLTFDPPPASIWRWCSEVSFSAQVLAFAYMRNPRRRLFTRADMQAVNKFLFYGLGFIRQWRWRSRRSTLRSGIASGLFSPSYSFTSSRPSRNLSAWFSCRHTSPVAVNELFELSCGSIRHGNPALIDELIDFLTTGKSGALLISELRRHGSRRQHPAFGTGAKLYGGPEVMHRRRKSGSTRGSRIGLKAWPSLRVRCSGGSPKRTFEFPFDFARIISRL